MLSAYNETHKRLENTLIVLGLIEVGEKHDDRINLVKDESFDDGRSISLSNKSVTY